MRCDRVGLGWEMMKWAKAAVAGRGGEGLAVRIHRAMLIGAVGAFAKTVTSLLNRTTLCNSETLLHLVSSRPRGTLFSPSAITCLRWMTHWSGVSRDFLQWMPGCKLHSFPEGKVSRERVPIRRLKWGTASLIVRSPVIPIVQPIVHSGFEKVMPEKRLLFWKRPLVPFCNKEIRGRKPKA